MKTTSKITLSIYQKLSKRLGELDAERRKIIQTLKIQPELGIKYLQDILKSFVSSNTDKWFYRETSKGSSYWRLIEYSVKENSTFISERKKSIIVDIKITWDVYDSETNIMTKQTDEQKISVFNDLEGQILNGRKPVSAVEVKKIVKIALTERKKSLETQLRSLKTELAKL